MNNYIYASSYRYATSKGQRTANPTQETQSKLHKSFLRKIIVYYK